MVGPEKLSDDEQLLEEIIASYIQAVEAGQQPARAELLSRHPRLAGDLQAFFADHDRMNEAALPVRPAPQTPALDAAADTIGSTAVTAPGALESPVSSGGPRLGDYELLEEIARGGMGVVYKARHVSLDRIVALKMILVGPLSSPADMQRFRTETQAAADLDHPNIVPIYEVGEGQIEGVVMPVPYFSMRLIEGGNLAELIADCKSTIADLKNKWENRKLLSGLVGLLASVARAVHCAHQHGILHRDLKPANILLQMADVSAGKSAICNLQSAIPMVTDFGLAKRVADNAQHTQTGNIVGTPSYMAPEQARAEKTLTTKVDVYSLGAILYELLTGRPPFQGETPLAILRQVTDKEPEQPRALNALVDADLETICLKCLQKGPERRYDSAEELARDLERWLAGEPILARPVAAWERTVKWARRRPALATLATVSGVSMAVFLVLAGFLWHNAELRAEMVQDLDAARNDLNGARHEQQQAQNNLGELEGRVKEKRQEVEHLKKLAADERLQALAARETARHIRYDADMQLAHAALETDNVPRLTGLLERHHAGPGQIDLRGFEWNYLWRLCHGQRLSLSLRSKQKAAFAGIGMLDELPVLAFSPDGKTFAWASRKEPIKLLDRANGQVVRSLPAPKGPVLAMTFADEKNLLLVIAEQNGKDKVAFPMIPESPTLQNLAAALALQRLPVDGTHPLKTEKFSPQRLRASANLFLAGEYGATAPMLAGMVRTKDHVVMPLCLALSPDEKTLAIGAVLTPFPFHPDNHTQEGAVVLWDLAKDRERAILRGHRNMVISVAFAPDGKTLASASFDKTIKLWSPDTGEQRAELKGHAALVLALAFSPDSKLLASGASDGMIKLWEVTTARFQSDPRGHLESIVALAFSPDGKELASAASDGTVKLWDLSARKNPIVKGFPSAVKMLAFSGDGADLLALDFKGQFIRSDSRTGKEKSRLDVKGTQFYAVVADLSQDGKTLAIGGLSNTVEVWDISTGKLRRTFANAKGQQIASISSALAFSPDGQSLAVARRAPFLVGKPGGSKAKQGVQVWELSTGNSLHNLMGHDHEITSVAFSPDGKLLASGSKDATARLWDLNSDKERFAFKCPKGGVSRVAFSPNGKRLAVAGGDTVALYDTQTGKKIMEIQGYSHHVVHMAFSPDGKRLATAGGNSETGRGGGVKLWDLATGQEVLTLGGSETASWVVFSPDGNRLAAAFGEDLMLSFLQFPTGEVRIWDATPLP